jgi:hypothetical protein
VTPIATPPTTPPEILNISVGGGGVNLLCQGMAEQTYDVQRAEDVTFTTGLTTVLTTNAPTGGQFTATDADPPAAGAFYRLKANP